MASRLLNNKDFNRRRKLSKIIGNPNRIAAKILNRDETLPVGLYPRLYTPSFAHSRLHARSLITGRARGVFNRFKMDRMSFKKYAVAGRINGIRKIGW